MDRDSRVEMRGETRGEEAAVKSDIASLRSGNIFQTCPEKPVNLHDLLVIDMFSMSTRISSGDASSFSQQPEFQQEYFHTDPGNRN